MNWKEFLKPTIGKVSLTIILLLLWLFYFRATVVLWIVNCITAPCNPVPQFVKLTDILNQRAIFSWITIVVWVIELLISYLVSCLVVFALNKIKNKSKYQP